VRRRRTHQNVNQASSPDATANTPVSAHCNDQNRLAGW
jgi:hypothetical protein